MTSFRSSRARSQERGGDRGKQGQVLEVLAETNRVLVEGINCVTKHVKRRPDPARHQDRRHRDASRPRSTSRNVALVDPETKKPTRVGYRVEERRADGVTKTVRVRYAKKSGKDL